MPAYKARGPMRRLIAIAIAIAAGLVAAPPSRAQNALRIVAVVNDDVISAYDVANRARLNLAASGQPDTPEMRARMAPQVLRTLIDERLQSQEATRLNVSVSATEIQDTIGRIERNNRMQPGQLEEMLRNAGIGRGPLEQQIRASIAWNKLITRRVRAQVHVGDDEVAEVLARLKASEGVTEWLLSEIFLAVDSPEQAEEVNQTALGMIQQMRSGVAFPVLAQQFSLSASAASGGDIGWIQQGQLGDEIDQVLTAISPGEVTAPIRTIGGYYIYGMRNRRVAAGADPQDAVLSLAQLLMPLASRSDADAQTQIELLRTVRDSISGCEDLAAVAKELGLPPPGEPQKLKIRDIAPVLRDRVRDLKAKEAAEPLRTPDAVVLLMACAREDAPSSLPSAEDIADSLIRQRVDLLARRYLRDLRRQAVVDIRA